MLLRSQSLGPISIGGVGGSGTRVVAELLSRMGVFIGDEINVSNDILTFPRFAEIENWDFEQSPDRHGVAMAELARFHEEMESGFSQHPDKLMWGWKAPPTYYFLHYFAEHFPNIRYIHVIRHGLDMAYSPNANQLNLIGPWFQIDRDSLSRPQALLKYWILANRHAGDHGRRILGNRFLLFKFDSLCKSPVTEISRLARFIGVALDEHASGTLCELVSTPASTGRYREHIGSAGFSEADIDEVRNYGFDVPRDHLFEQAD